MVIRNVTKRNIDVIKATNEDDYAAIMIAAKMYSENEKLPEPSDIIKRSMIAVITSILDKHHVKYINDLEMNVWLKMSWTINQFDGFGNETKPTNETTNETRNEKGFKNETKFKNEQHIGNEPNGKNELEMNRKNEPEMND